MAGQKCKGTGTDGGPCKKWAEKGGEWCRWHKPRASGIPAALIFAPQPAEVPGELFAIPEGRRLSQDGAHRMTWYRDLLNKMAEKITGGTLETLPRLKDRDEPCLTIDLRSDGQQMRLPYAAVAAWFPDRIEIAIGLENVLAFVKLGTARMRFLPGAAFEKGQPFTIHEAQTYFDGGDAELEFLDGAKPSYVGFICYAGIFLCASSPDVPLIAGDPEDERPPLPDLRVFDLPLEEWGSLNPDPDPPSGRKGERPSTEDVRSIQTIPQPTFQEARNGAIAIADGRTLHRWHNIDGEIALRHIIRTPKGYEDPIQTKLTAGPFLRWWGLEPTHESLRAELQELQFPAVLLWYVSIGLLLERPQVTVELDELIAAIGQDVRTAAKRQEWRRLVWRWLLLFDSMATVGQRRSKYRDRLTHEVIDLTSVDALVRVTGYTVPVQCAFDTSEPPLDVTLVAGPWLDRNRGDERVLSTFGDIRRIAAIPAGKPSGRLAQGIGLALQQEWRERASRADVLHAGEDNHLTVRVAPFTRRDLLGRWKSLESYVESLFEGSNPDHARQYWEGAIRTLREDPAIIGHYRPLESLPETRAGWREAWWTQPLDIRPAPEGTAIVAKIARTAKRIRRRRQRAA